MTLPKPIKDVIDFVLALPSALDKRSATSVRAPQMVDAADSSSREARLPEGIAFCWECHQFVSSIPSACAGGCCKEARLYASHYGRKVRGPLCPASGILVVDRGDTGPRETEERFRICNMRWANTTVLLGNTDFVRCRFFNCKLIDDGPFSMERCLIENCTIQSRDSYEKTSSSARFVR